jgi:hypothetical protein
MEKGRRFYLYQYLKTPSNKDIHKNHYKLRMMVYTPCASHIYNISYDLGKNVCVIFQTSWYTVLLNKHPFDISIISTERNSKGRKA